ncbi:glycosyltransferase [Frigoribacterium sp. 2-23]|uniref:glycosyltransferase n=1 Tax=Frigoribacterium sp. 2-23 TaxID=3415006 RepID=UPI003C702F91
MSGIIVHEWLEPHGGAEKVVEQLAQVFPDAPIKALWNDAPDRFAPDRVSETWLSKTPLRRHKGLALPAMPMTMRHLGWADADWILSSSHLFAHHARFSGPARSADKFVYAYTSARYIWHPELDERGNSGLIRAASKPLKILDRHRAQEPKSIASISRFVKRRLEQSWRRDSEVIYPPVEVARFAEPGLELSETDNELLSALPDVFLLGASRFIPYKRLDLVIRAGTAADLPVVLAGDGPLLGRFRDLAASQPGRIIIVRSPSQGLLRELYRRSLAYVFPPVEDFGIMPVEAMATGAAVIASSIGGAAETVIDGVTGILLDSFEERELRLAVERMADLKPEDSVARAWEFDETIFRRNIARWISG